MKRLTPSTNDRVTKWIGTVGLIFIGSFVVIALYLTLRQSFSNLANSEAFISAFMGAFLTFILVKFAELGTHFRKLERSNLNAIVYIQHDLNDNLNKLHNNDFVAKDILQTFSKTKRDATATLRLNFNHFKPVPIDKSQLPNLKDNLYLNEVFGYYASLEKLNDSLLTLQEFYNLLMRSKLSGQLDDASYRENVDILDEKIKEIRKFIHQATNETVEIIAKGRLLLKNRSQFWRIAVHAKPIDDHPESVKDELEKEVKEIWAQIRKTQADDQKRIQQILETDPEHSAIT